MSKAFFISLLKFKTEEGETMKRILAFVIVLVMAIGILPVSSFAAEKTYEYESVSGTTYISISDDDTYVTSDGVIEGTVMAYVPVDLAKLSQIKLEDYELEQYYYDADGNGKYEITVLQLYLYVLDNYYSGTASELEISGSPGSLFLEGGFWGHDLNLTYYVNGQYPTSRPGWGSTADQITLSDGDFVDVSMYTSWSFFGDSLAGYHFFEDASGITHEYAAKTGEALNIKYTRAWGDMMSGATTNRVASANSKIYYATSMYAAGAQSVTTDAEGKATITLTQPGTYYLWGYGESGKENPDDIVSAPSYAKVVVTGEAVSEVIYGDITGEGTVNVMDVIAIIKYYNGVGDTLTESQLKAADVTGDGTVNMMDVIEMIKYYNGVITEFSGNKK